MRDLLPDGVSVRVAGAAASLAFETPALAAAYHQVVRAEQVVTVSEYFLDEWQPVLRPRHFSLIVRLQRLARSLPDPAPTLADLAAATGMSVDAVRDFIRWWQAEREGDLEWLAVRAYVREIGPSTRWRRRGSPPYAFAVLLEDVIHPRHGGLLARLVGGEQRALALAEGLAVGPVPRVGNGEAFSQGSRVGKSHPWSTQGWEKATLASSPPTPPGIMTESELSTAASSAEPGHGSGGQAGENELTAAADLLAALGVPPDVRTELVRLPDGPHWVRTWCSWLPYLPPRSNLVGFLRTAIGGAVAGNERYRHPPARYVTEVMRPRRSTARAVAHARVESRARAEIAVPAGLEGLWTSVRSALSSSPQLAGLLATCAPIAVVDRVLEVAAPAAIVELLSPRKADLVARVQGAGVDLVGFRFRKGAGDGGGSEQLGAGDVRHARVPGADDAADC